MDIKDKIYFDNAASTPMLEEVIFEMFPFMKVAYGNASSTHSFGREAKAAIELARKSIAKLLNCRPAEIVFTSGGSESNNLAIHIAINALEIDCIITSKTEHKAILNTVKSFSESIEVCYVKVDKEGVIDLEHLEELLQAHPNSLLTLMHANNEIGNILPIERINSLVGKYGVYFHSDAVQTVAHYTIDLSQLENLHFMSASAHKFHGPKGVGFLYIKKGTPIASLIKGGAQERELRAGTENVPGIVGMKKALEMAYKELNERSNYISSLKKYLLKSLHISFPSIKINGTNEDESLYTILNVSFPPHQSRDLLGFSLDLKGIAVSAGSACSSGSTSFSHVLKAIGSRSDWPALRISLSHLNTKEEVDLLLIALKEILEK